MPQCKTNSWWSEPAMEELALATLTAASKEFKGDPKRTYLAGLSTGGDGSWTLAAQHPNKFAAVAPISRPRPQFLGQRPTPTPSS